MDENGGWASLGQPVACEDWYMKRKEKGESAVWSNGAMEVMPVMPVASGFPVTYLCGGLQLLILSQKSLGGKSDPAGRA